MRLPPVPPRQPPFFGLKQDLDLTYLYITHDLATATFFCNRVAIRYLGRIVEIGAAQGDPGPDPARSIPRDCPSCAGPGPATRAVRDRAEAAVRFHDPADPDLRPVGGVHVACNRSSEEPG